MPFFHSLVATTVKGTSMPLLASSLTPKNLTISESGAVKFHFDQFKKARSFLLFLRIHAWPVSQTLAKAIVVVSGNEYVIRLPIEEAITQVTTLNLLAKAPASSFIAFTNQLSGVVLAKLEQNTLFIATTLLKQPWHVFTLLRKKISSKSLNHAFIYHLNKGENILATFARDSSNVDNFIPLLNQLDYEVIATAALMMGIGQVCTLLEELFRCETGLGYALLSKLYADPQKLKKIFTRINHLTLIEFLDGGKSFDLWSGITREIISVVKPPAAKKVNHFYNAMLTATVTVTCTDYDFAALKYVELRGRTVVWQNDSGNFINAKIQRVLENSDKLFNEYNTTTYLKQNAARLKLQSAMPTPLAITRHTTIYTWLSPYLTPGELTGLRKMVGDNPTRTIYVYEVNPKKCDYLTYLQNPKLSLSQYQWANRAAVNDLSTLFARGIVFNQLGDIFHNLEKADKRDDGGRYRVLINLFWGMFFGSGRVTNWKQGVQYPNVRGSGGLADLADCVSIQSYQFNFQIIDELAGYHYVLFLIAGVRACELTEQARQHNRPEQEIKKIWLLAARQIIQNCAQTVSLLSLHSEATASAFLSGIVDETHLARQMQYWMTTAYIKDLMQNKIPKDIYGRGVRVVVNIENFRKDTFNERAGFSIDGTNPDLGPVNGQEPIKKANELFYWMITSILESYHQIRLTLRDLKHILQPAPVYVQEEIRKKSFTFLPAKSYHAIQLALCKERLNQRRPLPAELKEEISYECNIHKKKHAAITIFQFWKKRHQIKQSNRPERTNIKLNSRL